MFGDVAVSSAEHVARNWDAIKDAEKAAATGSTFDGVLGALPALAYARELTAKAAKAGFDWDDADGTLDKVAEELDEVRAAWSDGEALRGEVGDLLLAIVNLARHRGVDPESALRTATAKSAVGCRPARRWPPGGASTPGPPVWPCSARSGTRSSSPNGSRSGTGESGGPPA